MQREDKQRERSYSIKYRNIIAFSYWHVAALYGFYLSFTSAKFATVAFGFLLYILAEIGVTAGAHRLWTHKAYKARLPLEILLMVMNSISSQSTIFFWVRDHRLHHKYSDTDADPHNARRGFFFSHYACHLVKKHEDILSKGKTIDLSDIYENRIIRFQKTYAIPFIGSCCFVLPTLIPVYFWGETLSTAWHLNMLRFTLNLNASFLINSLAHMRGFKPYDRTILPVQNIFASALTFGEGFHNYHHVFPWDYRAAELGNKYLNLSAAFIDFFAMIGWAYDLKTVPEDVIKRRMLKTGDGTNLWGWDDKDFSDGSKKAAVILYARDGKLSD